MTKSKKLLPLYKKQGAFALEILCWSACFLMGIRYADQIKLAMLDTLCFCARTLVPTLFPYMILSSLLMKMISSAQRNADVDPAKKGKGALLPCAFSFLSGVLCGFPIGAQASIDLYNENKISSIELKKLFPLCNQCSLAFVTLGIGKEMLGSIRLGFALYTVMIVSALLVYILLPDGKGEKQASMINKETAPSRHFVVIVRDATLATLYTVGFLLLFSIPIALIKHLCQSTSLRLILTLALEFTGACRTALEVLAPSSPLLLPTLAFILSFGGICVGMQSELIVRQTRIGMRSYYLRKLLQGLFAFAITLLLSLLYRHFTN